MTLYELNKRRQEELSKIPLKGKSNKKLQELLILHSQGLAESLYYRYKNAPRLHMWLPEIGDYQSVVYEACLNTIIRFDYYRWKQYGDLKAKARIKKWRNGHGHKFVSRNNMVFEHLGHLYGYMFMVANTHVLMELQKMRLNKRLGMEVYPSQLKTEGNENKFFEKVFGPSNNQELENLLFHREIIDKLPTYKFGVSSKSLTFEKLYCLRYIEELTVGEIATRLNYFKPTMDIYIDNLNEELEIILRERRAA